MKILGAKTDYERRIRETFLTLPSWFVSGARVSQVRVNGSPEVKAMIASYQHGSRELLITPGVGDLMRKVIAHELTHGVDDAEPNGPPHTFSTDPVWLRIHRDASHFDIPKYRDEALEYLADMTAKVLLLGARKMRATNPDEVAFITGIMFPRIQQQK